MKTRTGEAAAEAIPSRGGAVGDSAQGDSCALHRAEARLRILLAATTVAASRASLLEACRQIGQVICDELALDFLAIWTLDQGLWALRCVDSWVRPQRGLATFSDGVRAAALPPGVGLPGRAWAGCKVQWLTAEDTVV